MSEFFLELFSEEIPSSLQKSLREELLNSFIKKFLEKKGFNLEKYFSKNFDEFLKDKIKIDHVFTVCSNAHNEVCPIWPKKKEIIHWDIKDPVKKF